MTLIFWVCVPCNARGYDLKLLHDRLGAGGFQALYRPRLRRAPLEISIGMILMKLLHDSIFPNVTQHHLKYQLPG